MAPWIARPSPRMGACPGRDAAELAKSHNARVAADLVGSARGRTRTLARAGRPLSAVALRVRSRGRAHADLRSCAQEPARAAQGVLLPRPGRPVRWLPRRQAS